MPVLDLSILMVLDPVLALVRKSRHADLAHPRCNFMTNADALLTGVKWAQLMLKTIVTMIVWDFELQEIPVALSGFDAMDVTTHRAENTILRLRDAHS